MYVDNNDFQGYLRKMSKQGMWGDYLMILVFVNVFQRNIWIVLSFRDNGDYIVIEIGNMDGEFFLFGYVFNIYYVSLELSCEFVVIEGMILINFQ